jgi:ribosome-associated heat shock protein Hsp15
LAADDGHPARVQEEEADAGGVGGVGGGGVANALRLDKWLWYARFFRSRTRAAELCGAGKIRRNRIPVAKAHQAVKPGDVLTFPQGAVIRVVRILALAARRGPASEARLLYEDLIPAAPPRGDDGGEGSAGARPPGSGRPTKRERRALDRLKEEE